MIEHTSIEQVSAVASSLAAPRNPYVTGYGRKIPTRHLVKYGARWRRVYVMQYANSGSAYILARGAVLFLDIDTGYALSAGLMPEPWEAAAR